MTKNLCSTIISDFLQENYLLCLIILVSLIVVGLTTCLLVVRKRRITLCNSDKDFVEKAKAVSHVDYDEVSTDDQSGSV